MGTTTRLFSTGNITATEIVSLRAEVRAGAEQELEELRNASDDTGFARSLLDTQHKILGKIFDDWMGEIDVAACRAILAAKKRHGAYLIHKALHTPQFLAARFIEDTATYFDIFYDAGIHKDGFVPAMSLARRTSYHFRTSPSMLNERERREASAILTVIAYFVASHLKDETSSFFRGQLDDAEVGTMPEGIIEVLRESPEFADELIQFAAGRSLRLSDLDAELFRSVRGSASPALSNGII